MQRILVLVGIVVSACMPASAAELVLVEKGQARAQVVVPVGAPPAVQAAAADFARVLQRMSGAQLAAVAEPAADLSRPRVLIGACKPPEGLDADPSVIKGDGAYAGYVVACGKGVLALRGNSPAGTANAVYGFLQDELGVRWFLPTELFEVVPARPTVTVPEMRRVVTPSFVCRLASASWSPEARAWGVRNRWDVDEARWAVPYAAGFRHWMYALFPPSRFGKSHPAIYPILNGKRAVPENDGDQLAQPCTGNPETVRLAIEVINAYLDAHPECHTYPFSINDNNTWCECDLCKAQDVERPLYRGRKIYSDRWFTFVNAVARGVRAKHPGKFLGCFAYAGVELPPLKIDRMEPNVFVDLTQDTAQYFDPAYRKVDYGLIRAWQQKCDRVGKYDYYGLGALAPRAFPHLLAKDLKAIHGMGVRAFHSEIYPYWANMGPMLQVASRLLWNVREDPDRILAEFASAFGPAAGEMRAFYEVHEAAWRSQKVGHWFGGIANTSEQVSFYTPAQVARAAEHLRKAEALATDETTRARVRFIARGYAFSDTLLRGWTAAETVSKMRPRTAAEGDAYAQAVAAVLRPLDGEARQWKESVVDDPVADKWYRDGARSVIRSQWRAKVQAALLDGLQTLTAWKQTPEGRRASPETLAILERMSSHPEVGFLWKALQGKLKLGPNLLPNPGFEDARPGNPGPAGPEWKRSGVAAAWSTWQQDPGEGVFFLDPAEKHGGKASGAFKGGECLCYITNLPVETGKHYLAEAWALSPAVRQGTSVTLEVRWYDSQERWFTGAPDLRAETKRAGGWERLVLPFTAPPGAARVVVLLGGYGIRKDDVVRFDDLFVGEAAE